MPAEKYIYGSREEWLKGRKNRIGGSDAAACMGLSPYKDNVQLWEEKMGLVIPEDISEKSYVQYGTLAEPHLRALFALEYPEYEVLYDENNMFVNPKYPWMHASLDGELVERATGRKGILEFKTTTILAPQQWEQWNNRIPTQYYCQLLHYFAVTEWDFAVLEGWLRYEKNGERMVAVRTYQIEREDVKEDIERLINAERNMWEHVLSGTRPHLILPSI